MGKRWRKYAVGRYRLGQLNGQAVVTWRDEAGPHRRRLGVAATEVEAKALLDAWVRRVALVRADSAKTVGDLYAAYRQDRLADGKRASNFDDSWKALGPRFASLPVDAITADVCRDYTRSRVAAGVSQGTVWTELTKLRSCLNWAAKRRVVPSPPPYVWLPTKPAPKNRVLEPGEAIRLIDACVMPHVRLFVILALTTGARKGALLSLTWDRVDFERGSIDLREPEMPDPLTKRVRKGRGVVPITSEARAALTEAKAGALSLYVIEWNGERIANVRKGVDEACKRAGIRDVTPHTLRHTAASWAYNSTASAEFTARLLGHRDPNTSRHIYAHPEVESLRPVADVIDMRIRRKG